MAQPKTKIQIGSHDVVVSHSTEKSPFERFCMTNQDQLLIYANDKDLPIVARVQNLILASLEKENFVSLTAIDVANYLGCTRQSASTALSFWKTKGLISARPKRQQYQVNPHAVWKGSISDHRFALKKKG